MVSNHLAMLGGAIIKLMNGVDISATISPLICYEKIPSGVSSAERFASFDLGLTFF
jgi:hypothetical protein